MFTPDGPTPFVTPRHLTVLIAALSAGACVAGVEPEEISPLPDLERVEPVALGAGSPGQTITVVGRDFVAGASVLWNGSERDAELVSPTALRVNLTAPDLAQPGVASVAVRNPGPGGGVSRVASFSIENPVPVVDRLDPATSEAVVTPEVSVRVFGSGFTDHGTGSKVYVNGTSVPATFVSATELIAVIDARLLQVGRTLPVRVGNPPPGGGTSTEVLLSVEHPVPVLSSVTPDFIRIETTSTLTVRGAGFVPGTTVWVDSVQHTPASLGASRLTFSIFPRARHRGGGRIWIETPEPGGGESNVLVVDVQEATPAISGTSPPAIEQGVSGQVLKVFGPRFAPDATVTVDGTTRGATLISPDTFAIAITDAEAADLGALEIVVENPRDGGPSPPRSVSVVPQGRVAYATSATNLISVRLNGADRQVLDVGRSPSWIEAWPVGDSVLFTKTFQSGLYMALPAGGGEMEITSEAVDAPRVSSDRQWVYFGLQEIRRMRPDGTGLEDILVDPPAGVLYRWPDPSPSGDRIAYARYQNDLPAAIRDDLQILDLGTMSVTSLGVLAQDSQWSPADDWIAYRTPESELRLIRPDGTGDRPVEIGVDPGYFSWSPDGRFLLYATTLYTRVLEIDTGLEITLPIQPVRRVSWFPNPS